MLNGSLARIKLKCKYLKVKWYNGEYRIFLSAIDVLYVGLFFREKNPHKKVYSLSELCLIELSMKLD